jgi:hypothetical protein
MRGITLPALSPEAWPPCFAPAPRITTCGSTGAKGFDLNCSFVKAPSNARDAQLAMQLEAGSRRERQVFDALEASVAFGLPELAEFEPVVPWHFESVSERQADSLRSFGIDPASVANRPRTAASRLKTSSATERI